MIFCARGTRTIGMCSFDARSGRSISPHPRRDNERAWREHLYRSMRAGKNNLPTPSGKFKDCPRPERLVSRDQPNPEERSNGKRQAVKDKVLPHMEKLKNQKGERQGRLGLNLHSHWGFRLQGSGLRPQPLLALPPTSRLQPPTFPQGGFTLVEILLAVSLVALMATLVFGSLYVTTNAIDVARANSATEQITRSTLRVMADELSVGKESRTGPWMGINGLFDGQPADSLGFLTLGQFRGADSNKDSEVVRIVYTREGDLLLRFVRKNLYGLTDESVERIELARKVKGFNVRYFDGKSNVWVDEWNGAVQGTPKALLLELTLLQENEELQTIRQWVTVGAP